MIKLTEIFAVENEICLICNNEVVLKDLSQEVCEALVLDKIELIELQFDMSEIHPTNLNVDRLLLNDIKELGEHSNIQILSVVNNLLDKQYRVLMLKDNDNHILNIVKNYSSSLVKNTICNVDKFILV